MLSHQTIFTKRHNAQSSAQDEINEIFDGANKYLDSLMTNSEGTPLYTELLHLSGDVAKFKNDLSDIREESERRIAAREFRNVFSIACNPDYSAAEKTKQLASFRNRMRDSSLSVKERLTRDTTLAIGLALIPIIAIITTAILCTPLSLIALAAAIPILAAISVVMSIRNHEEMRYSDRRGEKLSNNMISFVKNHNHLFARPKMNDITPPPYEQVVRYGIA